MKKIHLLAAIVGLIVLQAFVVGCAPSEPPATTAPGETKVGDPADKKGQDSGGPLTPPTN